MKVKRTIYLVTDFGGAYEDAWEYPYMAFDNEQAAKECAEKRAKRNVPDSGEYPESMWDEYVSSTVSAITVLMDEPTCENVYVNAPGNCDNGFECSACGEIVEDYEGYRITGTFNYCPGCGRKVVNHAH